MMTKDKLAIYTVIIGDGYVLPEINCDHEADYFCFTDQPNLQSNGWLLIPCEPILSLDLPRSSREQKIRPHRYLQSYQRSIYIDPSVRLMASAEKVWQYLIPNDRTLFGCFWHSFRETLSDEIEAVRTAGLEHSHVLSELQILIETKYTSALSSRPLWGGFIARRHMSPACIEAMEQWFSYVLRYSRRDQLTMPLAMSRLDDSFVFVRKEDINHSPIHRWPIEGYKRPERYYTGYVVSAQEEEIGAVGKPFLLGGTKRIFDSVLKHIFKR
ncbi:glycosyltransferase domain-containing protein [Rhizobium nepotum]|uniref:glycosyltransferase domain-containing protein n=1 Tax=Rhizobium nepotum TaxID=1035271 RepID=UPI000A5B65D2|nr:glycosyltransferase domain-containing protein [Rhizobium nepotum]